MRSGKLPPEDLGRLVLGRLGVRRPDVLVHAALGEDAAVIAFGDEACVVTVDPLTGAVANAGWLAVHVACNDLAAMGAAPVGVLPALMFPEQAQPDDVARLMADVDRAARELGIEVLGGHTEVTPGLPGPIITMTAIGRAPRDRVITSGGARPGQALVLTKAAGLEGSAILAHDFADLLAQRGVAADVIERARSFTARLSVVPDGLAAARLGARAMHDPTEGGVLGALWELAEASGVGYTLRADDVPVLPETRAICAAVGADPLKLISSGALLVACDDGAAMVAGLAAAGVPAALIGAVTGGARTLLRAGGERPAEPVWRDELWRVLEPEA